MLLELHSRLLDVLGRRLVECSLQEDGGRSSSMLLQRLKETPQRWVVLTDDGTEPAVPRFADVVCPVCAVDGCVVIIQYTSLADDGQREWWMWRWQPGLHASNLSRHVGTVEVCEQIQQLVGSTFC